MPLLVVLVAFLHAACDAAGTDAREEACVVEHVRKQLVQTRKSSVVEKYEKEDVDAANDVDNDEKKKESMCPWHMTEGDGCHKHRIQKAKCADDTYTWYCSGHGGRKQCPCDLPYMCNVNTCGDGTEHCCEKSCKGLGGIRDCDGKPEIEPTGEPVMRVRTAAPTPEPTPEPAPEPTPEPTLPTDGICFGGTTGGMTSWQYYSAHGIKVKVDESACKFKNKPVVVTSLTGVSSHWTTTGGSSVYSDTASSYTIYVHSSKGIKTANAQKWKWASDFLAQIPGKSKSGTCAGETPLGSTKWVYYSKNGIYVDVDTSACGFSKTPVYKTSIGGASHHWTTTGASSVYKAKKNSFRIYIHQKDITEKNAKKNKYHIKWIAHPVGTITVPGLGKTCAGKTVSGKTAWKTYENGKGKGIYVDVKTGCNFRGATPRYVTEVAGSSHHWTVTGTSEVYSPTATGFRMYLFDKSGIKPSEANKRAWSVQWIAAASEPDRDKKN